MNDKDRVVYLAGHPFTVRDNFPCGVCNKDTETVYLVEGTFRCMGCARSWKVTHNNVVLRLVVFNRNVSRNKIPPQGPPKELA